MGREARARANRQRDLTETAAGCLQLLDEMAKDAFARFGSSGTLAATFLVVPSAGKAFMVAPGWEDNEMKARMLVELRAMFREMGVVRYAVVTEAWVAPLVDDPRGQVVRPGEHPSRKEVISLVAVERGGEKLSGYREILRPWDGSKPTFGPIEIHNGEGAPVGRLLTLLDD